MSNSELDFTPPEPFLNRLFVHGYDELSSFVLSSSLILSYLFNQKLFDDIKNAFDTGLSFSLFLFIALAAFGIFISFYHIFSKKLKDKVDKVILILFSISIQSYIAFIGLKLALSDDEVSIVFPILNALSALITLWLFRQGLITHKDFSDKDVTLSETFLSLLVLSLVIIPLSHFTQLHWVEVLSISVLCGNQISGITNKVHLKLMSLRF